MPNVLKEYLVSLGWDIKHEQLKKFDTALISTGKILERFAVQLGIGATAVAKNVMATAEQLDKLYFAGQRVGTTAYQLRNYAYAARQIGVAGEEMQGAISAVGIALRMPGESALLKQLGVQSTDASEAVGQLADRLRRMPYFVGQQFAQQLGIGPQMFQQMTVHYDQFQKHLADIRRRTRESGGTGEEDTAANRLMTEWRTLESELGLIEQKVLRAFVNPLTDALHVTNELLTDFAKIDDKLAGTAAIALAVAGAFGAWRLTAFLGRSVLGLGGGAAAGAAGAAGAAAAGGGAAATAAQRAGWMSRLGSLGVGAGTALAGGMFIPDWMLSEGGRGTRRGIWNQLQSQIRRNIGQPGASPGFHGHTGHPIGNWFNQTMLGGWLHGTNPNSQQVGISGAMKALQDWLHGSSSFTPKVQLQNGIAPKSNSFWDTLVSGASTVGSWISKGVGPKSANAALPPGGGPSASTSLSSLGVSSGGIWYTGSAPAYLAEHGGFNFAGIRHPKGGFRTYPNEYSGVADAARLLQSYERGGYNTLEKIVNRWAPPNENNTSLLLKRAQEWMGVGKDQPLNLHDPETLTKLLDVMNRNEFGTKRTVTPENLRKYTERFLKSSGAPEGTTSGGTSSWDHAAGRLSEKTKKGMAAISEKVKEFMESGKKVPGLPPGGADKLNKPFDNPQPWVAPGSGSLSSPDAGKQSNVTINMNNDFQVSGFAPHEIGREVVRGLGRQNADLVRNLQSAVG